MRWTSAAEGLWRITVTIPTSTPAMEAITDGVLSATAT